MVYQDKFVVSVKVGGKILREHDRDHVYLPFGKEYSILLKNLESRKALVTIRIDGQNVLGEGEQLVLDPKQTVDLKRFIIDGNMDTGPRFKFIEKTSQISEHRGDKLEDGIVEVEYQFEVERRPIQWLRGEYERGVQDGFRSRNMFHDSTPVYGGTTQNQVYSSQVSDGPVSKGAVTESNVTMDSLGPANDQGITVPGQDVKQSFGVGHIGTLEDVTHTICLKLHGGIAPQVAVKAPLTVKSKIQCKTCGTKNKSTHKCCSDCGTNLTW